MSSEDEDEDENDKDLETLEEQTGKRVFIVSNDKYRQDCVKDYNH